MVRTGNPPIINFINCWMIGADDGMSGKEKVAIWAIVIAALGGTLATMLLRHRSERSVSLKGAVIKKDTDTKKELPIAQVQIMAAIGDSVNNCKSDSSGFFQLNLAPGVEPGTSVTLQFRHPDYLPLDLNELTGDKLYVA